MTLRWLLTLALAPAAFAQAGEPKGAVDFRSQVLPLLSDRCFACHGPDSHSRQADLRLDDRDAAIDYGAIVPGDASMSTLVERILSDDPDLVMPPRDAKQKLTPGERELLRQWVEEGAPYEKHWAFTPPTKPPLPAVNNATWGATPIDRFITARLEKEGLEPSPPADRRTLIRRLYFDLTGLPPSAEEVEQFESDTAPDAYERLVDRLLESPHYGERMALGWLDAARYADTNGYSIDGGRHMWLWRDWVIHAFNQNKPYDEFLVEQLAGDLLPDATDAQRIATGMQRNNMVTHEGGTIPEENLANYNADRVKTLGEAVLGLTLACAQCHDHKYDPISHREYFQLFAFFNTIGDQGLDGDGGVNPRPYFEAKTVLQTGEEASLRQRIERLERQLATPDPAGVDLWEAEQRKQLARRGKDLQLQPIEVLRISTPSSAEGLKVVPPHTAEINGAPGLAAYDVVLKLPRVDTPASGLRIAFLPAKEKQHGLGHGRLPGGSGVGTFVLTAVSISDDTMPNEQVNLFRLRTARQVTASSWHPQHRPENVRDARRVNGWSPKPGSTEKEHLTYTFDQPLDASTQRYLTVQVNFGYGEQLVARKMQFHLLTGNDDGSPLPPEIIAIVQTPRDQRTSDQQAQLQSYYAHHSPAAAPLRIDLANTRERLAALTLPQSTMIMAEAESPRPTHILLRGDYSQPGDLVTPGVPAVLPQLPDGAPANRLSLARWAVEPDHPLTARVAVNRFWQQFFGQGLVRSSADFGLQGAYPSHPELLDWLAVDFVEHRWDVKRLVRAIVTSSTYRQTARADQDLMERDPQNELLARGPRFRLPAEFIRDAALKTSGLLVPQLGGPSVNPYAPGDLWREVSHYGSTPATAQTFSQDHGEKLYRRSLYTYWKRTVPPPNLATFDAPSRETCTIDRPSTNTPLQALVLLNDVQFVEAARAFAERMVGVSGDDAVRLEWAFREALSRPPETEELEVLMGLLQRERQRYAADPVAAQAFLSSGESPRNAEIPLAEHAAWGQVAAALLNLSETITRN